MPAVTECTAHCPLFSKQELAGLAGQSSASNSIAPINRNENFVILKTGSINGAGDNLTVTETINGTHARSQWILAAISLLLGRTFSRMLIKVSSNHCTATFEL